MYPYIQEHVIKIIALLVIYPHCSHYRRDFCNAITECGEPRGMEYEEGGRARFQVRVANAFLPVRSYVYVYFGKSIFGFHVLSIYGING